MPDPSLVSVADGTFAYLQRGGWGYSNAGLVTSEGASLLVDTLYDARLTAVMLASMRRATSAAACIDSVVNTHANGDHCWGNQLVKEARIVSSRAARDEMREVPPRLMRALVLAARGVLAAGPLARAPLGLLGRLGVRRATALRDAAPLLVEAFGPFDFGGVRLRLPDETFEGELTLKVGAKEVRLIEVGPAHTRGDVIVHVPADRVAFSGDILFVGSHPIVWEGPIANWIAACDRLLALDVDVVVPGHGPLTDRAGVRATRDYFTALEATVREGRAAGATAEEIAREILARHDFAEAERVVVNVDTALRELSRAKDPRDPLALLAAMARFARA